MVDIDRLEPTSAAFARQLLRTQPWLRAHARVEDLPGRDQGFLVLSVPSPSRRPGVLTVDTGESGRISVSWGRFSAEFDAPPNAGRSTQLDAALDLVEDVLSDRVALYVLTRDGRWSESGTAYDERDEQALCRKLAPGIRIELFSWEGTRDHVLTGDDLAREQA